jgi:hypothetical protein
MIHNKKQKGVYAVEFAIVASLFLILLFAVLECSRLLYTWNVLTEVSRRGARLATVCHITRGSDGDISIPSAPAGNVLSAAAFGDFKLIPNLSSANIDINYLKFNGEKADTFSEIRLVRAEIKKYSHQLLIPFIDSIPFDSPSFSTTLPRESLGVTKQTTTTCL